VAAIEKVGRLRLGGDPEPGAADLHGPRRLLLGERITLAILSGTLVVVLGTTLLSVSGRHVGFRPRDLDLSLPVGHVLRRGRDPPQARPRPGRAPLRLAINITARLIASTAFVLASGKLGAIRYDRRSFLYFAGGGAFENTGSSCCCSRSGSAR
jgi:hypothetical protein